MCVHAYVRSQDSHKQLGAGAVHGKLREIGPFIQNSLVMIKNFKSPGGTQGCNGILDLA